MSAKPSLRDVLMQRILEEPEEPVLQPKPAAKLFTSEVKSNKKTSLTSDKKVVKESPKVELKSKVVTKNEVTPVTKKSVVPEKKVVTPEEKRENLANLTNLPIAASTKISVKSTEINLKQYIRNVFRDYSENLSRKVSLEDVDISRLIKVISQTPALSNAADLLLDSTENVLLEGFLKSSFDILFPELKKIEKTKISPGTHEINMKSLNSQTSSFVTDQMVSSLGLDVNVPELLIPQLQSSNSSSSKTSEKVTLSKPVSTKSRIPKLVSKVRHENAKQPPLKIIEPQSIPILSENKKTDAFELATARMEKMQLLQFEMQQQALEHQIKIQNSYNSMLPSFPAIGSYTDNYPLDSSSEVLSELRLVSDSMLSQLQTLQNSLSESIISSNENFSEKIDQIQMQTLHQNDTIALQADLQTSVLAEQVRELNFASQQQNLNLLQELQQWQAKLHEESMRRKEEESKQEHQFWAWKQEQTAAIEERLKQFQVSSIDTREKTFNEVVVSKSNDVTISNMDSYEEEKISASLLKRGGSNSIPAIGVAGFNYENAEKDLHSLLDERLHTDSALELAKYMDSMQLRSKLDGKISNNVLFRVCKSVDNLTYASPAAVELKYDSKLNNLFKSATSGLRLKSSLETVKVSNEISNVENQETLVAVHSSSDSNLSASHLASAARVSENFRNSYLQKRRPKISINSDPANNKSEISEVKIPVVSSVPVLTTNNFQVFDIVLPEPDHTEAQKLLKIGLNDEINESKGFQLELPTVSIDSQAPSDCINSLAVLGVQNQTNDVPPYPSFMDISTMMLPKVSSAENSEFDQFKTPLNTLTSLQAEMELMFAKESSLDLNVTWLLPEQKLLESSRQFSHEALLGQNDLTTNEVGKIAAELVVRNMTLEQLKLENRLEKVENLDAPKDQSLRDSQILDMIVSLVQNEVPTEKSMVNLPHMIPLAKDHHDDYSKHDRLLEHLQSEQKELKSEIGNLIQLHANKPETSSSDPVFIVVRLDILLDWKQVPYVDLWFDILGVASFGGFESNHRRELIISESNRISKELDIQRKLEFESILMRQEEANAQLRRDLEYSAVQSTLALTQKARLLEFNFEAALKTTLSKSVDAAIRPEDMISLEIYIHNPPAPLPYQPELQPWAEVSLFVFDYYANRPILANSKSLCKRIDTSKTEPVISKIDMKNSASSAGADPIVNEKTLEVLDKLTDLQTKLEAVGQLHWHALQAEAKSMEKIEDRVITYMDKLREASSKLNMPCRTPADNFRDDISFADSLSLDRSISVLDDQELDENSDRISVNSIFSEGEIFLDDNSNILSDGEIPELDEIDCDI